jgi:hypothetical protein
MRPFQSGAMSAPLIRFGTGRFFFFSKKRDNHEKPEPTTYLGKH